MTRLLIVIASTRPGRVGGAVGQWAIERAEESGKFDVDIADLSTLQLPFLDEPEHPRLRNYRNSHTLRWSTQVDAANAFMFVIPEYNHSFSAPIKNALDFLVQEWEGKQIGLVSYGGLAGGTRAVVALQPVLMNLGLLSVRSNVEIAWVAEHVEGDVFTPTDRHERALRAQLSELATPGPS